MRFVDLIDKKAHGDSLTTEEIQQMVTGFVSGEIPDFTKRYDIQRNSGSYNEYDAFW